MLSQIAEALGTDANTVLYGTPDADTQKQKKTELVVSAVVFVLLYALYRHLAVIADNARLEQFDTLLDLWVGILFAPFIFCLIGWLSMQAVMTFSKSFAVDKKVQKICGIISVVIVAAYLVLMLSFLLPITMGAGIPRWLSKAVYFTMGVLPWQTKVLPTHLIVAALVGIALRLTVPTVICARSRR